MDMIINGGYVGYFCIEQNEINDTQIRCGPKLSECSGKGKMEFNDDNIPIQDNYYNGYCRKCTIDCDFNHKYYQLLGEYPLWHVMLYKKLKLLNSTISIIENDIFIAWIENIHLIDIENIEIKFSNDLFQYSNLKIEINKISFKVNVENNDLPNFVTRIDLLYGLKRCKRYLNIGYIILTKPNIACKCEPIN